MKKSAIKVLVFLFVFSLSVPLQSAENTSLSSWLDSMMAKVVEFAEQQVSQGEGDGDVPVAVAGLRGKKKKADKMEPYWKGELTRRSTDYLVYRDIEKKMQEGNYRQALQLIEDFKKTYKQSKLLPEVYFTHALAFAGIGKHEKAVTTFQELIKRYPQHDLVQPSKEGISRLKKA